MLDGVCLENSRPSESRSFLAQRRLRLGSFKNVSQWNGILAGLSFNRQSIFDSLAHTLNQSGDVQIAYPDQATGLFKLVESIHIATAIISSSTTPLPSSNESISTSHASSQTTESLIIDNRYSQEATTEPIVVSSRRKFTRQTVFEWFYRQLTRFGLRGLVIGSILSICLLFLLLLIIIHLHCKNRHSVKSLSCEHSQSNGQNYSQIKRYSVARPDGQPSKRCLPKLLGCLRRQSSKPTSSFRLASNGSVSRLNSGDSYHLIASIQETRNERKRSSHPPVDEQCYVQSRFHQPLSSPCSLYHQVNRAMITGTEPSLPLSNVAVGHASTATLRSLRREIDSSSTQTYSAVYSCDLAANLDIDQDTFLQTKSPVKRRSILKPNPSVTMTHSDISYLYMKNLVDCYAIQVDSSQRIFLATADENRIQLFHARVSSRSLTPIQRPRLSRLHSRNNDIPSFEPLNDAGGVTD